LLTFLCKKQGKIPEKKEEETMMKRLFSIASAGMLVFSLIAFSGCEQKPKPEAQPPAAQAPEQQAPAQPEKN